MSHQKPASIAYAELLSEGIEVDMVWGNDYTLTVDLDTEEAKEQYPHRLKILRERLAVSELEFWTSRHGKGEHHVLRLAQRTGFKDRAALQAFLGSDPLREMLGWFDVNNQQEEDPFVLFKPKGGKNGS